MSDKMAQLAELATKQLEAEQAIMACEDELKKAQLRLRDIAETQIPELMEELGLEEYKTTSGLQIKVPEVIRASISKARLNEALTWLREHGHEKLIKDTFSLIAGSNAAEIRRQLKELGLEFSENPTVNSSTLTAFVKQQLQEGVDIPLETFSVYRQRVSKVSL